MLNIAYSFLAMRSRVFLDKSFAIDSSFQMVFLKVKTVDLILINQTLETGIAEICKSNMFP
jgi:hypothetical protein